MSKEGAMRVQDSGMRIAEAKKERKRGKWEGGWKNRENLEKKIDSIAYFIQKWERWKKK